MTNEAPTSSSSNDPFKAVEAASDAIRNSVYDWFKGSLMTRFDNPAEGAVIIVMQPLHQDDLVGRLRDEGGWEYLAMPGEYFERTVFDLGDEESWTLNAGDLLYPERLWCELLGHSIVVGKSVERRS
jgi:hypothetical protein